MGVKVVGVDAVMQEIGQRLQEMKADFIEELCVAGEQAVNAARMNGSYTDRTGNLRSSTGYVVVDDGRIVRMSGYEPVKPTATDGQPAGRSYAEELAAQFSTGMVLILVAGMNYATYVHDRGYDVLTSAELIAEQLIKAIRL